MNNFRFKSEFTMNAVLGIVGRHVIWLICLVPQNLMLWFSIYFVLWYIMFGKRHMEKGKKGTWGQM